MSVEEFICPLSKKMMEDPILAADGIIYEANAFETWILTKDVSPTTGKPLSSKKFTRCESLRNTIQQYKTTLEKPQSAPTASVPFVKIVDAKLTLMKHLNIPDTTTVRIVSILGKARMGKSTFLNSIVSRITGQNVAPFQTQDSDEHCTRGMDAYYCKEQQLLLLDCQGLALEDSSHDPALLLFAYLISDTIVFNERMMLQNEALKLLEPICTFMAYINLEEIQKPKLFFRISDGDMVKNPAKNLEKVMMKYNDQYQSIRDSVAHLFQPGIGIVKTDSLDRPSKTKLQSGDYLSLFATSELGFGAAIDELLAALPKGQSAAAWKKKIPIIVENINRNEKITIEKLDVVGQTARLEIMEWINALSPELFYPISVIGTQASYDANVKPRKNTKKSTLSEFTRLFKSISGPIKDTQYAQLQERLAAPITDAEKDCVARADTDLIPLLAALCKHTFPPIKTLTASITNTPASFYESYLGPIRRVQEACKPLYEPVRVEYEALMKKTEDAFMDKITTVRKAEAEEILSMTQICKSTIDMFESTATTVISDMINYTIHEKPMPMLFLEPAAILTTLIQSVSNAVSDKLLAIPKLRTIQIKGDIIEVSHPSLHLSYDTIKPIIEQFRTDIEHFKTSSVLLEAILNRKKMLLYGKAIDADTVIPGLDDFVDIGLDETIETIDCVDLKMTSDTYQDIYMKNIDATLERMKAKQYISEKDVKLYYDDSTNRHLVHKLPFINTMFRKTYAKTLAVAYTTGKPVVEYMDLSLTEQSAQITWSDYEELS
jgi:hypothetical protein